MAEFFSYEHIKELVTYCAFGWMIGMTIGGCGYWIAYGVKWVLKKLKKRFCKDTVTEEEIANE